MVQGKADPILLFCGQPWLGMEEIQSLAGLLFASLWLLQANPMEVYYSSFLEGKITVNVHRVL